MFRTSKRWMLLVCAILLALGSPSLSLYIKLGGNNPNLAIVTFIVLAMLALTSVVAYHTYIKPLRDVRAFAETVLHAYAERLYLTAKTFDISIRVNVLMLYRPWYKGFFVRHFRIAWGFHMNHEPDGAANFHCAKGVCGEVLRTRKQILIDMGDSRIAGNQTNWRFTPAEVAAMPRFTCIWSWPIFQLDKEGNSTGTILGTLNMDSDSPNAHYFIESDPSFKNDLQALRDLICKLVS